MSDMQKDPVTVGEILHNAGVFAEDGTINKLGVIALFTNRDVSEVDPLELKTNEELGAMVVDRDIPIEVVKKIGEIGRFRSQLDEQPLSEETELRDMTDDQLIDLLRQKDLPQEVLDQILVIAQERSRQGNLPSEND